MRLHTAPARTRVVVIGAGFSGTLTSTRLLQFAEAPIEVCLLERDEGARYGGIAFGETGTTWNHMLNIQAGRITYGRERPEDFLEWANEEADRSGWPPRWQYHVFGVACVVPRRIYGQYLKERLLAAASDAAPDAVLTQLTGEAVDVEHDGSGWTVRYAQSATDGQTRTLRADYVVFATGHLEPVHAPFYRRIERSDRFIADPYSAEARAAFAGVRPDETVLIAGSALSAFDTMVSLINVGHTGNVVVVSRGGHMHGTYPADHQHDIWTVRRPPFLDAEQLTPEVVVEGVRAEYEYLRDTLDCDERVLAERVMKAWEPYVIELLDRMDARDVRQLLDRYKSLIVTNRTSTVPEIGNVVRHRMRSFRGAPATVTVLPAEIVDMRPAGDGQQIRVSFADRDDLLVDRVINCLGNDTAYDRVRQPLWSRMVQRRRLAMPHGKTHRGIEVGAHGEVLTADGTEADGLFCVGPMRQGDETARRGRLGAFVFSIGTLRNQCFDTATEMLRRMRTDGDKDVRAIPADIHLNLGDAIAWTVEHFGLAAGGDTREVQDLLSRQTGETLVPATREYLTAQTRAERLKQRQLRDGAVEAAGAELAAARGLDPALSRQALSTFAVIVERHVVHAICDITRLAAWDSQYREQVRPTFQQTAPAMEAHT
ncbi:FAD/NAD(P)-binding protein [Actinoplanes sp. NPDC020271]|uniref:FAD/NAD(P)-binding protein n=1 Tax=Actinoplanes sp. NPDC020271 TaxID=3363896 RepID=UPI0037B50E16